MFRDYKIDTWGSFNQTLNGRKLFLFGAVGAEKVVEDMEKYNSSWSVEGVLDNDSNKWGRRIQGRIEISSPGLLKEYKADEVVVLICSKYSGPIGIQLQGMGIENYYSEYWMSDPMKDFYLQDISASIVESLEKILADELSKDTLRSVVQKRKTGFVDYTDIKQWTKSEYFVEEFWSSRPDGNEVYVDGGGYDGDTIEEFVDWTKGNYRHIYAFEPQKDKAEIIKSKLWKYGDKISFYEKGLWSEKTTLAFSDGNESYSGKIVDAGDSTTIIETVALDDIVKEEVTFIKMDIEGAEIEALKGAKNIIMRDKPRLAICIYHKPDDLWKIPELIHEMVPEYKLYIRHMGIRCYDTILYAVI